MAGQLTFKMGQSAVSGRTLVRCDVVRLNTRCVKMQMPACCAEKGAAGRLLRLPTSKLRAVTARDAGVICPEYTRIVPHDSVRAQCLQSLTHTNTRTQ
jgi:hypothetical protein